MPEYIKFLQVGDWLLTRFPQVEPGKLSHPWHGFYKIVSLKELDVAAVKVYLSEET